MMKMQVIKSITKAFSVRDIQGKVYIATARSSIKTSGIFVGDYVDCLKINGEFVIEKVLPRKNILIRPNVCNIDQMIIVIATEPEPDLILVDKQLLFCYANNINPIICINKTDLGEDLSKQVSLIYTFLQVISISTKNDEDFSKFERLLDNKNNILVGQSAVGKTSIINKLIPHLNKKTDILTKKTNKGKNTTRECEMYYINNSTSIIDSPGFSKLNSSIELNQIGALMPDFTKYSNSCKFQPCMHISEPSCAIKNEIDFNISKARYSNYLKIINEMKTKGNKNEK